MEEIILQYTGEFQNRFLEASFRDGEHLRVVWSNGSGEKKVVFTGSEFFEEDFQKRITGNHSFERKEVI